jgi:putative endonuclease
MRGGRRGQGDIGEDVATASLEELGWTILDRNAAWRCGELDIVAWDGDQLVFVEVKSRRTRTGPRPEDGVDQTKQRKIIATARRWMHANAKPAVSARFDVISVDLVTRTVIAHHRGAFEASAGW